jgi:two-component system LytT family response regulator
MSGSDSVRALIVDDEPLARRGVRVHLDAAGGFEVIGECASGRAAIRDIRRLKPDVVFLDVQMPGMSGFDVVNAVGIGRMPATVFVTAYDTHALRAFEAHAVDYLLKPIDPARFRDMAERVRGIVRQGCRPQQRLVLRDGAHVLVLPLEEIDWIAADGDYVRVYVGGRGHLVRHTIGALEAQLDPRRFARIHRSTIVNVERVREVMPRGDRGLELKLRDGTLLGASRAYRTTIRDRIVR